MRGWLRNVALVLAAYGMVGAAAALPRTADAQEPPEPLDQPNVVVILLDDVSENLLPYMAELQALADRGVTFENYFNASPLCCPSRVSIQAGRYPHNTGVRTNRWPGGGWGNFYLDGIEDAIGVRMQAAGYRTGLLGKYINGYEPIGDATVEGPPPYPAAYVPPGWDSWWVGDAYQQFAYQVTDNTDGDAQIRTFSGSDPSNYNTDQISSEAQEFLHVDDERPFFLVVSVHAAHRRLDPDPDPLSGTKYPPAPRDRAESATDPPTWPAPDFPTGDCGPVDCADVAFPDPSVGPMFNVLPDRAPRWMPDRVLTDDEIAQLREFYVQRIQMLQSADDMLRELRATLDSIGEAGQTYVVVTSDNGFHLGEHALPEGKTAAYDHDTRVPMIVWPPGGVKPRVVDEFVQNVDLLPTVLEVATGAPPSDVDGVSLLEMVDGGEPEEWRQAALIEYTSDREEELDLDAGTAAYLNSPTYNALRTTDYLYTDFSKLNARPPKPSQAELYDLTTDPYQLENVYRDLSRRDRRALNAKLRTVTTCVGSACEAELMTFPDVLRAVDESGCQAPCGERSDAYAGNRGRLTW